MSFALRYPKQIFTTWNSQLLGNSTLDSIVYLPTEPRFYLPVAPARYSNVRKVVFWWSGTNGHATTDADLRMRIAVGTLGGASKATPNIKTVADESGLTGTGSPLLSGSVSTGNIFNRLGDAGTLGSDTTRGGAPIGASQQFTIEFDRFSSTDQDFFDAWFQATEANEFMEFLFMMEVTGSNPPASSVSCSGFGITIVQAPGPVNNTCTYLAAENGRSTSGSGRQDFDSTLPVPGAGTADTRRTGLFRFRYNASEWDGITGVHFNILTGAKANGADLLFRLVEILDDEARTTSTIFTETFDVSVNDHGIYRSRNFLSLLEDGKDYGFDWRHSSSSASGASTSGDQMAHWEIIQQACTKTTTYFESRVQVTPVLTGVVPFGGGSLPDPYDAAGHFDPAWYANYPDDLLLVESLIGSLNHQTVALDPTQALYINPLLLEDMNAFANALSPTTAKISPEVDATPLLDDRWVYEELPISTNNPIDLAGKRKIHHFSQGGVWQDVAGNERPGLMALKYVHTIPLTEVLELGSVFNLDAFNPEGCASTSAGLGDPGVLVITNGSSIPQKFDPVANVIQDAGIPPPFSGEIPSTLVEDSAISPEGGLTAGLKYNYCYTFRNACTGKESNPSPDLVQVDTTGANPAAKVTLSFTGLRIPPDDQIDEICVYRSLGDITQPSEVVKFRVGCFAVDLVPAVFVDTLNDATAGERDPLSNLNGPNPCVTSVDEFRNRLFGLGDIPQLSPAGTVDAVTDSTIITGSDDVDWDRCLVGKFIQLQGDCRSYEITEVLPPVSGTSPAIQRLKILEPYEGGNVLGALYTICGHPNRLFFSEPLEPECWPEVNFLDIEPGDGDRLVGLKSNFGRLAICKRNKTYVLAFSDTPSEVNVPARVSSDIGCIGPRTFAQVESGTVWLADRGLALFDGRGVGHIPESSQINDLFVDESNPRYVRRNDNGIVVDAVGVFYPKREQYLLLLPTIQTERGANLMLVWDVKERNITLLEFCQEFQSMVVAKDSEGNERVYLGDTNGFVWLFDIGDTDGVGTPGQTGTVRGTISTAGVDVNGVSFLQDIGAKFIEGGLPSFGALSGVEGLSGALDGDEMGLAGVCLFVEDDAGEFTQQVTIFASTLDTLYVTPSWGLNTPLAGRRYMLGPIRFDALFKPRDYGTSDSVKRNWRQVLTHDVQLTASELRIELLPDFSLSDDEQETVVNESGETGRLFNMDYSKGRQTRPIGRRIHNFMGIRMTNFAPEEPIAILNHTLGVEGVTGK